MLSGELVKSEEEDDNETSNIQIFSDANMPKFLSKKKKRVTVEQLKNWEIEKV